MKVTVFGGTGFIGRWLVGRLTAGGASVRVVSRRAGDNAPVPPAVEYVAGDIGDPGAVEDAVEGAAAVVNLVGTTTAGSKRQFYAVHREGPAALARAARRAGVSRFVHVSAMGVAADAPSLADRSKAAGEAAVREAFPDAGIARPSLVYGPGDHFFTLFGALVRGAPAIPLIGGGRTRFQPMHVEDIAEAIARMLEEPAAAGRTFELGGDEVVSFRELVERLCRALGRRPWLVPVPFPLALAGAYATQWLPRAPLTADQVRLLKTDKVWRDPRNGPAALGVRARPLENFLQELAACVT